MKKVSLMVVAALLSASIFANSANLPKGKTVKGAKPKTEMSKTHKQKDKQKGGTTKAKAAQKAPKKASAHK